MPNTLHANMNTAAVTLTTTTETVLATLSPFAPNNPGGEGVVITFDTQVTTGTGVTALVYTIRQGTTTAGAVVGTALTVPATASAAQQPCGFSMLDTSALALKDLAGLQYVVTVSQTGATGNGSVSQTTIQASSSTQPEA